MTIFITLHLKIVPVYRFVLTCFSNKQHWLHLDRGIFKSDNPMDETALINVH